MRQRMAIHAVMMCAALAVVLGGWTIATAAHAEGLFGRWMVRANQDRFSDSALMIASVHQDDGAMSIRCRGSMLDAVLIIEGGHLPLGASADVITRVDKGQIQRASGKVFNAEAAEFKIDRTTVAAMRRGREIAVRLRTDLVNIDRVFPLVGAPAAFATLAKSCLLDE